MSQPIPFWNTLLACIGGLPPPWFKFTRFTIGLVRLGDRRLVRLLLRTENGMLKVMSLKVLLAGSVASGDVNQSEGGRVSYCSTRYKPLVSLANSTRRSEDIDDLFWRAKLKCVSKEVFHGGGDRFRRFEDGGSNLGIVSDSPRSQVELGRDRWAGPIWRRWVKRPRWKGGEGDLGCLDQGWRQVWFEGYKLVKRAPTQPLDEAYRATDKTQQLAP
ncbi:hypothetical protein BDM02DRAFT_3132809 [Thelephora ganbajun]|uniref:Uncharacterized protein n=1 Tax=Thelephora ganbajun TaxID=370292 RepID=A0ACB6Z167_THEGA|nr:hypothetical protein BDM02DRAFT_3132809 [Thelephora ganbajun]